MICVVRSSRYNSIQTARARGTASLLEVDTATEQCLGTRKRVCSEDALAVRIVGRAVGGHSPDESVASCKGDGLLYRQLVGSFNKSGPLCGELRHRVRSQL